MREWSSVPCKLWTGATNGKAGYGLRKVPGTRRNVLVHRASLEEALGRPLRPGMQACHHCDTPACYEPAHLFEGSQGDNLRDMTEKGRHVKRGCVAHRRLGCVDCRRAGWRAANARYRARKKAER